MPLHVVVIGAGVAGLQAARALTKRGCSVLLLESSNEVGGVWARGYSGFGLQVPAEYYQFGEFPWPDDLPREEYPSGASVHRYCRAYASHFGLLPLVRYGCRLVRLRARRPHGWRVVYECAEGPEGSYGLRGASSMRQTSLAPGAGASVASSGGGGTHTPGGGGGGGGGGSSAHSAQPILSFSQGVGPNSNPTNHQRLWRVDADYVVVATGIYALPQAPQYRDAQRFQGLVMHAKDFRDATAVRGRHVLVVGAGKSALDVGGEVAASRSAASITWLMRQAHWPVPRALRLLPGPLGAPVPAPRLIFSRASPALLLPPYYNAGLLRRAAGALAAPLQRLAWRAIERAVVRQFGLRGPLLPKVPLRDDLFFGGQILDATWTRLVQYGAAGGGVRSSLNDGAESVSTGAAAGERAGAGGGVRSGGGGSGVGRGGGRRSRGSGGRGGGGSSGGYRSGDAPAPPGSGSAGRADSSGDEFVVAADAAAAAAVAARQQQSSPTPGGHDLAPSPSHSHPLPTVDEGRGGGGGAGSSSGNNINNTDGSPFVSPFSSAAAAATGPPSPLGSLAPTTTSTNPHHHSYQSHHPTLPADACGGPVLGSGSDPFSSAATARPKCCHVRPLLGEIARFVPRGVVLRSGEEVYCDAVLMCTGYQKTYDYLDGSLKARLGLQKDGLWLYRHVLAPLVPGLAFIGPEASTFNNVLTSGLQAEWLAALLCGRLAPGRAPGGVEAMLDDVCRQQAWRRKVMPVQHGRGACVQMYAKCYHAQLLRDLGLEAPGACGGGGGGDEAAAAGARRRRRRRRASSSCFSPLTAEDYAHAFVPPDIRHPDDEDVDEEEEGRIKAAQQQQQQEAAAAAAAAAADGQAPQLPPPVSSSRTDAAAAAASAADYWRPPPAHLLLQPPGSFVVRERMQRQQRDALVAALVGAPPPDGREWTRAEPAEPSDLAGAGPSDASGGLVGGGGLPAAASLMPGATFVGGSGAHAPSPFSFSAGLGGAAPAYSGSSLSAPSAPGGGGIWRPGSASVMMTTTPQQQQQQYRSPPPPGGGPPAGGWASSPAPTLSTTTNSRPPTTLQSGATTSGALGRDSSTQGGLTSASDPPSSGPLPRVSFGGGGFEQRRAGVAAAAGKQRQQQQQQQPPQPASPAAAAAALQVLGGARSGSGSGSDPAPTPAPAPPTAAAAPPSPAQGNGAATPARNDPRAAAALASLRAWHAASPAAAAADRLIAASFPQQQ